MRNYWIIFLTIIFSNLYAGDYDIPMITNAHYFNNKNEIKVGYSVIQIPAYKTIGTINFAYSITDKLSVSASTYLRELGTEFSNKYIIDFGLGYNVSIDNQVFSIGMGYSTVEYEFIKYKSYDINFREYFHFNKYYIQPSFMSKYKFIEMILSTRFALLDFYDTNSTENKISVDSRTNYPLSFFQSNLNDGAFFSLEPCFTLLAGWKHFQFQFQYGLMITNISYNYTGLFGPGTKRLWGTSLNLGVVFTISPSKRIKTE